MAAERVSSVPGRVRTLRIRGHHRAQNWSTNSYKHVAIREVCETTSALIAHPFIAAGIERIHGAIGELH